MPIMLTYTHTHTPGEGYNPASQEPASASGDVQYNYSNKGGTGGAGGNYNDDVPIVHAQVIHHDDHL